MYLLLLLLLVLIGLSSIYMFHSLLLIVCMEYYLEYWLKYRVQFIIRTVFFPFFPFTIRNGYYTNYQSTSGTPPPSNITTNSRPLGIGNRENDKIRKGIGK
ncbi:hypothetical protein BO85DRAFT_126373 [Aspergillus piperis CBS 112811]|uniref:Uncharacterized protein n=1 Tax=Aspergillus piperis CBS 112811 TaxID=1448313 RepID=A0A8G1VRN8_9EURO|nr:hypothetical protein BO85DRAFT_126373 [Aspergillus piperis CBS 112811]RAH62105.1 hypothetical protein BO85DRAFT_126373 [Aspergillus piperis CBS 112811]